MTNKFKFVTYKKVKNKIKIKYYVFGMLLELETYANLIDDDYLANLS